MIILNRFSGTPNRMRRGERESARGAVFTSQTSTVTEAASDEVDDLDSELPRVTQYGFLIIHEVIN